MYHTQDNRAIEINLTPNKFIQNDIKKEEVSDMKSKKQDITEDAAPPEKMEANYVKMTEAFETPDPEAQTTMKKSWNPSSGKDMKKEEEEPAEAGEEEAEVPNDGKPKKKPEDFSKLVADMVAEQLKPFQEVIEKQQKIITDLSADKEAEKLAIQEDLINDMSSKYLIPKEWLKKTSEKYGNLKADFIQDIYEANAFAFGGIAGHEIEDKKEDMKDAGSLVKVEGL